MTSITLRGMASRKLRTALTALAIVLGVSMISGTYVLTDTIDRAFTSIFAGSYEGTDLVISSEPLVSEARTTATIPVELLDRVRTLPGVEAAAGAILDFSGSANQARLVGSDGEPLGKNGNPTFGIGFDPDAERFNPLELASGRWATGPREVVVDAASAADGGLEVGGPVGVSADGPTERYTVVGIARFGDVDSLGGATIAAFDLDTARQVLGKDGFDSISVAVADGTSVAGLEREIASLLPSGVQVQTGDEQAVEDGREITEFVDWFRMFLLAFGVIALFVGAFVIFNTLSITVAQRTRELATLRTLGASRRQVMRSVIVEAGAIGLAASAVGLGLGLGLARLLEAAFGWLGVTLPEAGTVLEPRTVAVSLLAGTLIAVLAGLVPALRATRVAPIAAVREGAALPPGRFARFAPVLAIATIAIGGGLLGLALFADGISTGALVGALAVGVLVLFVGVAAVAPRLVRPLAFALGAPGRRLAGTPGLLASENAARNPGRTAATAAALMIGLALVTLVAVLGNGLREANENAIAGQVTADYVVSADDGWQGFPAAAGDAVAAVPGVSLATSIRADRGLVGDDAVDVQGVDPSTIARGARFQWASGSDAALAELGRDGAIVRESLAEAHDLAPGERFILTAASGKPLTLTVRGTFSVSKLDSLLGGVIVSQATFDSAYARPQNGYTLVSVGGVADAGAETRLEQAVAAYPGVDVDSKAGFVEKRAKGFSQLLNLLYVLLALSIVVSLLGMVNTLVLSVFERTREIGMLRAVGTTRRQIRTMVRLESVTTALIGATLGIGVGVGLAALVTRALAELDVPLTLPAGTLAVFALVAAAAGVVAAMLPARRAARLNVLEALKYE